MFKSMRLIVGTLFLAVCVVAPMAVSAQDQQNPPAPAPNAQPATPDQQNAQPGAPGTTDQQNGNANGRRGRRSRRNRNQGSDMNMNTSPNSENMGAAGTTGTAMAGSTTPTPIISPYASGHINWSSRYELTPLEQKRLQAMGLTAPEVYAVANAARRSGHDIDDIAQMVLRGESYWDIARDLGINYNTMLRVRPDWQTPEWQEAVKEGSPVFYAHSSSMGTMGGENRSEGGMR